MIEHPGTAVPADKRPWSVPWPEYAPVDITPPELRPAALATTGSGMLIT